jgi:membrane protein DedA with SNARE-associated domain
MLEAAMTSPWVYLALFAAALLDAFFPIVPSEAMVITATVFAAQRGEPNVVAVVAVMAVGAIIGDHIAYWIGARIGPRILRRPAPGSRLRAAFDWAQSALKVRGGSLLIVARYVPGGRTATTLTMGAIGYPRRRFAVFDTLAAAAWALYASMIGYLGGATFAHDTIKGLVFGLGLATAVTVLVEGGRRVRRARTRTATASASAIPEMAVETGAPTPALRRRPADSGRPAEGRAQAGVNHAPRPGSRQRGAKRPTPITAMVSRPGPPSRGERASRR